MEEQRPQTSQDTLEERNMAGMKMLPDSKTLKR